MFYIRADANEKIGTGHIMRCLSIAEEWRQRGEEVTFITADYSGKSFLESRGYRYICLNSEWDNLDKEISGIVEVICKEHIDKILVDTYYVTEIYLKELCRFAKVIYLDDLGRFVYPVHLLINYNNYFKNFQYESVYHNFSTKFLLGCKYVPLRREYRNIYHKIKEKARDIIITSGGADQYNVAGSLTKIFLNDLKGCNYRLHIVAGKFNSNKDDLEKLAAGNDNINLYYNINNMEQLMVKADIAITAGGTTLYELCACGTPMITYSMADNQLESVREFKRLEIAEYCGDVRNDLKKVCINIWKIVEIYVCNVEERKKRSLKMRYLVDGKGSSRIVDAIKEL